MKDSQKMSNEAIAELMSDAIQPHIANSAQLLKKMEGYNDIFKNVQSKISEMIKSKNEPVEEEKNPYFGSKVERNEADKSGSDTPRLGEENEKPLPTFGASDSN